MEYIIVKLGGSLITDKTNPYIFNRDIVENLVDQAKYFLDKFNKQYKLIIVHGSGSFGHTDAVLYNVKDGFEENPFGACRTHYSAQTLNQLVTQSFIDKNISVISLNPSSFIFVDDDKINPNWQILDYMLSQQITPLFYGDIILDKKRGCQILSGEKIINLIVDYLMSEDKIVSQIIHLGIENGVYDANKNVISLIDSKNIDTLQFEHDYETDSTGGMEHKVMESYNLAKKGIKISIVNGLVKDSFYKAMIQELYHGTIIKK